MKYHLYKRQYTGKAGKTRTVWWYWFWVDGKRMRKSTGCTIKWKAEKYIDSLGENAIETLSAFSQSFFFPGSDYLKRQEAKHKALKPSTARLRQGHLETYIIPKWGNLLLSDLNAVDVENWLISLILSNSTKNQILYTLKIVCREAVRKGIVKTNPIESIEALGLNYKKREILSDADIRKLFPEDPTEFKQIWPRFMYGVMYAVMLSGGLRSGEVRALMWDDIYYTFFSVKVDKAIDSSNSLSKTKGGEKRAVVLPERTIDLLRKWEAIAPYRYKLSWVFTNGSVLQKRTVIKNLSSGIKRAKIKKHITPHCLRHTYNTKIKELFLSSHTSADILRELTGHKSVTMTDYYDHPEIETRIKSLQSVRNQIELFWS